MLNSLKKWISIKKNKNARLILLLSIIIFNILLWLISSILAYIISPNSFGNVFDALWKTGIAWMLEPGFYNPDVEVPIRIISLIVIITSMITFTGGIIGYVGNIFSSVIDNSEKGRGKLYIYDHILILNWNNKALELIADYQYDDLITNIVILSSNEKSEIEKLISRKFYEIAEGKKLTKKINIIVREGDVFSRSDLNDVCIDRAKAVIILSSEANEEENNIEMRSIKTLMLVSNINISNEQTIIFEARKEETLNVISEKIANNLAIKKHIIPLLPDEMMGRLIAQTILFPEVNNVYQELFSFKGAEFYTTAEESCEDFMLNHNKSIPIYNYDSKLYVLSEGNENINSTRKTPYNSNRVIKFKEKLSFLDKNIIVFGNNNKLKYILDSIRLYQKDCSSKVNITLIESNDAKTINDSIRNLKKIDTILILSEDNLCKDNYDSDVLLTLLMIQDIAKIHKSDIIIELLDPKHYDIAQSYNIRNTIISNKYISRIISQLSNNYSLYYLFHDLLTYDEMDKENGTYEIYTYKAENLLDEKFPVIFNCRAEIIDSCYKSSQGDYIVIGLVKNNITDIFKGDLDRKENISIQPEDIIIVISK